jgi:hypothetical protein
MEFALVDAMEAVEKDCGAPGVDAAAGEGGDEERWRPEWTRRLRRAEGLNCNAADVTNTPNVSY